MIPQPFIAYNLVKLNEDFVMVNMIIVKKQLFKSTIFKKSIVCTVVLYNQHDIFLVLVQLLPQTCGKFCHSYFYL